MAPTTELHKRVKLETFELAPTGEERCAARVVLAWDPGESFVGQAEGTDTEAGRLRCAAEATARALERATHDLIELDILAVRAVDGFDTIIVVVALNSRMNEVLERLVGACLIKGNPLRGAAAAVLDATNRLLGKVLYQLNLGR